TGAGNGNNGTGNGNNGTGNGNNGAGHSNNGLDNVPKTGDNSPSPIFYMALALMSLIAIGFCLLSSKKKKNIQ
ncbi:LPXTG cell wall anchor domain-containing protein, partial [Paenibacillus dendritiformis]|uniref:LPXTG cell wall anchor domain-containing protein n=1 Tax=Paenibacillus dendritiformis TaxID=130049 RepID=UPI00387E13A6